MKALIILIVVLPVVALIALSLAIRVVTQYEKGVLFRRRQTQMIALPAAHLKGHALHHLAD